VRSVATCALCSGVGWRVESAGSSIHCSYFACAVLRSSAETAAASHHNRGHKPAAARALTHQPCAHPARAAWTAGAATPRAAVRNLRAPHAASALATAAPPPECGAGAYPPQSAQGRCPAGRTSLRRRHNNPAAQASGACKHTRNADARPRRSWSALAVSTGKLAARAAAGQLSRARGYGFLGGDACVALPPPRTTHNTQAPAAASCVPVRGRARRDSGDAPMWL
jgi:hypothetical protein